jgi:hypothetical protein
MVGVKEFFSPSIMENSWGKCKGKKEKQDN